MTQLVLSLFPGIGLLDRAFEEEGFTVVRGPDALWGGDIRRFHPPARRFDGVIGGPPCQAFSALATLVRANGGEPRFGNLIPEFNRCVEESEPDWFVMENVPKAPLPDVTGYDVRSFILKNHWLPGEGVFGQAQMRTRRFSFGRRGSAAPNLMRWIDLAPLHLPEPAGAVSAAHAGPEPVRRKAVFGDGRPTRREHRHGAVTSSDGGKSVRMNRYTVEEAAELQGLPANFLSDAPFTREGKLKAIANGVPLPMGRAIARAVKEAMN